MFDPRHIEDVLDRDLVSVWREEDATAAVENRPRAAGKAALTRYQKSSRRPASSPLSTQEDVSLQKLRGWEEFESDGFLR